MNAASLGAGALLLVLQVAAGWWPMRRFGGELTGGAWLGRVALAAALGAAIIGIVQVGLAAWGLPASLFAPAALAALSALLTVLGRGSAPEPEGRGAAAAVPGKVPALLLLLVAVASTSAAVGLPFRSDGIKFWAPRARELAEHGALAAPALGDRERFQFHREYPLLVPALMAPAFKLSPRDATTGPKLVLHGTFLALIGLLASWLSCRGRAGVVLLLAFLSMPILVRVEGRERIMASGFADGTLALFLLLLVACADALRRSPERRAGLRLLGVLAGAALLSTKLEGIVAFGVVHGAWLLVGPHRRADAVAAALGALLLASPTFLLRAAVTPDPPLVDPALLLDPALVAARLLPVLAGLVGHLLDASALGLLPAILVVVAIRPAGGRDPFLPVVAAGAALFLVAVYLATTVQVAQHLDTSAHRLLFHWLPALTLLVARSAAAGGSPAAATGPLVSAPDRAPGGSRR